MPTRAHGFSVYNRSMEQTQSYPAKIALMLADLQNTYGFDTNDILQAAEFIAGETLNPSYIATHIFRNKVYELLISNNIPKILTG